MFTKVRVSILMTLVFVLALVVPASAANHVFAVPTASFLFDLDGQSGGTFSTTTGNNLVGTADMTGPEFSAMQGSANQAVYDLTGENFFQFFGITINKPALMALINIDPGVYVIDADGQTVSIASGFSSSSLAGNVLTVNASDSGVLSWPDYNEGLSNFDSQIGVFNAQVIFGVESPPVPCLPGEIDVSGAGLAAANGCYAPSTPHTSDHAIWQHTTSPNYTFECSELGSMHLYFQGTFIYFGDDDVSPADCLDTWTLQPADWFIATVPPAPLAVYTPIPNAPPVANDDLLVEGYFTPCETNFFLDEPLLNDFDPDGDPFNINTVTPLVGNSSFTDDGTGIDFVPNPGFSGVATLNYTLVDDPGNVSNTALVEVTVGPCNSPPVTVDDAYEVIQGQVLNVAAPGVLANDSDPDGDPLRAFPSSNPSNGVAVLALDGSFIYTPNAGFSGLDSFTYVANDFTVNGNIATISITVKDTASLIADAQALLDDLLAGGDLSQKNYDSLDKKLDKIVEKLSNADPVAACNQADSAISKAADYLAAGDITQQVHDDIVAAFNAIKLSIPC